MPMSRSSSTVLRARRLGSSIVSAASSWSCSFLCLLICKLQAINAMAMLPTVERKPVTKYISASVAQGVKRVKAKRERVACSGQSSSGPMSVVGSLEMRDTPMVASQQRLKINANAPSKEERTKSTAVAGEGSVRNGEVVNEEGAIVRDGRDDGK